LKYQFQLGEGADGGVGFRAESGEKVGALPMHLAVKLKSQPTERVQTGSLYYWPNTAQPRPGRRPSGRPAPGMTWSSSCAARSCAWR